jgi:hypothetical protein
MPDRDDKPPVSMIPDYPFRARTMHDANLAATRASAAATYWKMVAQEAEARVQQLEAAIRAHREPFVNVNRNRGRRPTLGDRRLWDTLPEEASDGRP